MHLIHKLRRSISHRPRHLFDLPDEILCQILEYCCQDLDFLLWSCPLVTLDNQFCHDCFHCTLCHGPAPRVLSLKHRRLLTTVTSAGTSKEAHGQRTESANESATTQDHLRLHLSREQSPALGTAIGRGVFICSVNNRIGYRYSGVSYHRNCDQ
ncbi:hypothetical protein EC957_011810 [Mortierella hygrophila]|uniref:Uncharacterized protein n=1 Tax=Mortierella hygrophila TaxID=979708 RepID=A0A9P6F832_9FUNG|nr:hypothetical protein EC957_011810 [Mortierella hygrophila]